MISWKAVQLETFELDFVWFSRIIIQVLRQPKSSLGNKMLPANRAVHPMQQAPDGWWNIVCSVVYSFGASHFRLLSKGGTLNLETGRPKKNKFNRAVCCLFEHLKPET